VARKHLPRSRVPLPPLAWLSASAGTPFCCLPSVGLVGTGGPFLLYSSLSLVIAAMSVSALGSPAWPFVAFALILATLSVTMDRVSPGLHAAFSVLLATVAGGMAK